MNQLELPHTHDCTPPIRWLTDAQLRSFGWIVLDDATDDEIDRAVAERLARPSRRRKERPK